MLVRDAMTPTTVEIGVGHSLAEAARRMAASAVGAAVVQDPDGVGPGIVTERDVLRAVADGIDLEATTVADRMTSNVVYAGPDWSLESAADAMIGGGFRHLVVLDGPDVVGMLSVRDVLRSWSTREAPVGAGSAD